MKNLICMTLALAAMTTGALAEERSEGPSACRADIQAFCKDIEPGGGRIMKCMAAHKDDLSDRCKGFMTEKREEHQRRNEKDRGADDKGADADK